ncbi:MAG: hypothetical protein ABFD46_04375 [Armatimonadota bacterium]
MRQWIREHPWRLEIVPFAMVAYAAAIPLLYRREMLPHIDARPGFSVEATWLLEFSLKVATLLIGWLIILLVNHLWVKSETEKRYNYRTPLLILLVNWSVWPALRWIVDALGDQRAEWIYNVWFSSLPIALFLACLLEYTRKAVIVEDTSTKPVSYIEDIKPGEPFYYRETQYYQWVVIIGIICLVFISVFTRLTLDQWWPLFFIALPILLWITYSQSIFTATNERITVRLGIHRVVVSVSDIKSCGIQKYHALADFGGYGKEIRRYSKLEAYIMKSGYGLYLETNAGKKYLFGMKNPETACKLINTAIAARQQSESDDK